MYPPILPTARLLTLLGLLAFPAVLRAQTPLYINSEGRVGINTPAGSPLNARLHVNGSFLSDSLTANGPALFHQAVTMQARVGIGAPPSNDFQLFVRGMMSVTGPLYLNGGDKPYFLSVGKRASNQTEIVGYDGVRLGLVAGAPGGDPDKFLTMVNALAYGVGIGTRDGARPRARLDLVNFCNRGDLSIALARLANLDDQGDGTYLGVRAHIADGFQKNFSLEHRIGGRENGSLNFYQGGFPGAGYMTFGSNGSESLVITSSGTLSYGTIEPNAPIDVQGFVFHKELPWADDNLKKISIRASDWIMGAGFHNMSDARHKKDIGTSKAALDLALLRRLRVADFRYMDSLSKGRGWQKGFIAQDVESVFPQAVQKMPDCIPDIYAAPASFAQRGATLELRMAKPHGLQTGDRVRIIAGSMNHLQTVEVRSAYAFSMAGWQGKTDELFVFGREVPDFRTVDYQQLTALSIGAVQSVATQVDELKKENDLLRAEVASLKKEAIANGGAAKLLADLERRVQALEGKSPVVAR